MLYSAKRSFAFRKIEYNVLRIGVVANTNVKLKN